MNHQSSFQAFRPENRTAEALGADPSGPRVHRTNPAALLEGYPTSIPIQGTYAPFFMIDIVHKYPGQVDLYSAGPLTNIALAVLLNDTFAQNVKSIIIQGGSVDPHPHQVIFLPDK